MEELTIIGNPAVLDKIRSLVGGWEHVLVDAPDERANRLGGRASLSIKRGDPAIDVTSLAGVWKDRDDLTVDTLRDRAWAYRRLR